MFLLQLEFGRVFDGDDALIGRDEAGEDVQQGGLAGPGAAGDEDVQFGHRHGLQDLPDFRGEAAFLNQVLQGGALHGKPPDTKHGPVQGQGRDDGVDPGAVGQPGIHHGDGLIDAAPHVTDDLIDDFQEVLIILEPDIRQFQTATPFDVHLIVAVYQDIRNGRVGQQRFQGAQTQDLELQFPVQAGLFRQI